MVLRLKDIDVYSWSLSFLAVFIPIGALAHTFLAGELYVQTRPRVLVPVKLSIVAAMGAIKVLIPNLEAGAPHLVFSLFFQSNSSMLMMLTLGLQNKFRTHVMLQLVLVAVAMQFSPLCCRMYVRESRSMAAISGMAGRIDSVFQKLMMLKVPQQETVQREDGPACWFTVCFFQWSATLITGSLLYCLESHSRVMYLLSCKQHSVRYRRLLWRTWRCAVLMSGWICAIGLMVVYVVLKMSTEIF